MNMRPWAILAMLSGFIAVHPAEAATDDPGAIHSALVKLAGTYSGPGPKGSDWCFIITIDPGCRDRPIKAELLKESYKRDGRYIDSYPQNMSPVEAFQQERGICSNGRGDGLAIDGTMGRVELFTLGGQLWMYWCDRIEEGKATLYEGDRYYNASGKLVRFERALQ